MAVGTVGCSNGTASGPGGTTGIGGAGTVTHDAGATTAVGEREQVPAELAQALGVAADTDGPELRAARSLSLETELDYDPLSATGLDLIQRSALALSSGELDKLEAHGLVISTAQQFPTFQYGYKTIYSEHLPLYVSADSILYAVHRSYDQMLKLAEQVYLIPTLGQLLDGMRDRLAGSEIEPRLRADLDLYLTLARSLLQQERLSPVAGADVAKVKAMYELATEGEGHFHVQWFGSERDEDFSQFKPRGHYTDSLQLQAYFRAMMLLGRVDLRIIETQSDGSQIFRRQQFDAAVALNDLLGADREQWTKIDEIIGGFVGERDSMSPDELGGLLTTLAATDLASTGPLQDRTIVEEIARGGWGAQRIASRILVNDVGGTLPLDRSFALFGQRYAVDSHVFVNTTYDRVAERLMPDPLDVAFAALGNDAALELLATDLAEPSYAAGLAKTRTLVDAHGADYWDGSLYTSWLAALRALSPSEAALAQQPSLFSTRMAQNRILNTQLASWAELRHDTILYAKQSYTLGNTCEFPDAYVDPYPELYARLGQFAERVGQITALIPTSNAQQRFESWVENFKTAMSYLERMAQNQQTGAPHEQELMDFINAAVNWEEAQGCGTVSYTNLNGWYLRLFFSIDQSMEEDPTIADVHTQPFDAAGNDVGRILHVGTGRARLLVTAVETCNGPRAYVGLASSFGQTIEEDWKRLTDPEWVQRIGQQPFPDPPWMSDVLATQ